MFQRMDMAPKPPRRRLLRMEFDKGVVTGPQYGNKILGSLDPPVLGRTMGTVAPA